MVISADNIGKQFGPRSGPMNCQAWSGSKLFDILMVFLKEIFQKVNFEKKSADDKKAWKITQYAISLIQTGPMEIYNHTTKHKAVLTFKQGGWFGKDLHKVEGYIMDEK